jgi:hypothetical protein
MTLDNADAAALIQEASYRQGQRRQLRDTISLGAWLSGLSAFQNQQQVEQAAGTHR